jgi:shikimate dehydrogenase
MRPDTDQYGVVGHPVSHSWSPFIHGWFARDTGQDMAYRLYDFAPREFLERVTEFFARGGRGLNVTLPHKMAAVDLASELTSRAAHAGAVNTLTLKKDGTIIGDNTDGEGLVRDLCDNIGVTLRSSRVLLIGAGGAARGSLSRLLSLGPDELVIANRTPERAVELASRYSRMGPVQGVGLRYISGGAFDLIINTTSVGLTGEMAPLPQALIGPQTVCYDMSYSTSGTPFVRWAVAQGCTHVEQGWGMLVEQAAESFRIWRNVRPQTAEVLAALKEHAGVPGPVRRRRA